MHRPSREIQTFNLAMLDVICSALGAFLILFILANQEAAKAQAEAQQAKDALEREQQKALVASIEKGTSLGDCQVNATRVEVRLFDHGGEDNDRVKVSFNKRVLRENLVLSHAEHSLVLDLPAGPSVLVVQALNVGDSPPNTAAVIVDPCQDGKPKTFSWKMDTGELSSVSIERR